jgi:hypothetical protein
MNLLLRSLMSSDTSTNRPLLSLILLGIFDFVCVLEAGDLYKDRQIIAGTWWLVAGVTFSVIGYYWTQIRQGLGERLAAIGHLLQGIHTAARPKLNNEDGEGDPKLILVADASRDFSADSNPSGSWAYGYYRGGLGGDFLTHQEKRPNLFRGVSVWESPSIEACLSVMHHGSRQWIQGSAATYAIPPDTIYMHPGEKGAYVVVRWTCQQAGTYRIWYEFLGLDAQTSYADSDIDVRHNLQSLCKDKKIPDQHNLNGIGSRISHMSEVLDLKVRDTIDFVVGCGQGGSYGSDSTGLKAKIYQSKTGI